jgi:hypothetical protein
MNEPALRVYGAFPDETSALQHAAIVQGIDPACNLQLNRTHEWIVAAHSAERLSNAEVMEKKRSDILSHNRSSMASADRDFRHNLENKVTGGSLAEDDQECSDSCPIQVQDAGKKAIPRISRMAEVRDQGVVVISVLPDKVHEEGEPPEFIFKVYRCCENEESADLFVRNVASVEVTDHDIDVVTACEWLYPQQAHGKNIGKELYRDEELQNIMDKHKRSGDEVNNFRKWNEKQDEYAGEQGRNTAPPAQAPHSSEE